MARTKQTSRASAAGKGKAKARFKQAPKGFWCDENAKRSPNVHHYPYLWAKPGHIDPGLSLTNPKDLGGIMGGNMSRSKKNKKVKVKKTKRTLSKPHTEVIDLVSEERDRGVIDLVSEEQDNRVIDLASEDLTTGVIDLVSEETTEEDNEVVQCCIRGNIVGLQYYRGTVNDHEMVNLVREPQNPYDNNAIRVENVIGQKVGHIKRELAKPLARIIDNGISRVEGSVPFGSRNTYTMSIDLTLWGLETKKAEAITTLRASGYYPTELSDEQGGPGAGFGMSQPQRTYLSPDDMKNELDKLFENLEENDKTSTSEPAKAVGTKLYTHQQQALHWMVEREKGDALPPFWEARGGRYFNNVTRFSTDKKPSAIKGGILADDMGLGKTLEMISLILTNFRDGEPLAVPVPGKLRKSILLRATKKAERLKNNKKDYGFGTFTSSRKKLCLPKSVDLIYDSGEDVKPVGVKKVLKAIAVPGNVVTSRNQPLVVEDSSEESDLDLPTEKKSVMLNKDDPDFSPPCTLKENEFPAAKRLSSRIKKTVKYEEFKLESDDDISSGCSQVNNQMDGQVNSCVNSQSDSLVNNCVNSQVDGQVNSFVNCEVNGQVNSQMDGQVNTQLDSLVNSCVNIQADSQVNSFVNIQVDSGSNSLVDTDLVIIDDVKTATSKSQLSARRPRRNAKRPARFMDSDTEVENPKKRGKKNTADSIPDPHKPQLSQMPFGKDDAVVIIPDPQVPETCEPLTKSKQIPGPSLMSFAVGKNDAVDTLPDPQIPEICESLTKSKQIPGPSHIPFAVGKHDAVDILPDPQLPGTSSERFTVVDELPDLYEDLPCGSPGTSKCGKHSGRTQTKGPRATLIVAPLSVLSNWMNQFEEHVHENVHLEIYMYYGPSRTKDASVLAKKDVVLTTYSTLAADFKPSQKKDNNPLQKVEWLRLVLDEGHVIRNPNAQQTKAICQLKAHRKWILSGTPIQNSMKDLWSLIKFLQIEPFTEQHWWRRTIERNLQRGDESALKRVQHLMTVIAMRRTKTQKVDGKPLVELPERKVYLETVKLSEEERSVYTAMQNEGKIIVSKYFSEGTLLHHYGNVLAILMRLRQMCCHPMLVAKAAAAMKETLRKEVSAGGAVSDDLRKKLIDTLLMVLGSGSDEECAVCLDTLKDPVITHCAHVYCRACIENVIKADKARCPLCRGTVDETKLLAVPAEELNNKTDDTTRDVNTYKPSTKVDALMDHLTKLRQENPKIKSIVVSQFTSLLSLVEIPLSSNGFHFTRLDGTMNLKERTRAVEEFSDSSPGSPSVLLLSLKAGGVGINLTAASRVFLMDPAWNPASEDQCFDRCHRLGQTRDVIITKFIVEDSVEERMCELQDEKRKLMQGAFGSKKETTEERRQNRIKDICRLMDF